MLRNKQTSLFIIFGLFHLCIYPKCASVMLFIQLICRFSLGERLQVAYSIFKDIHETMAASPRQIKNRFLTARPIPEHGRATTGSSPSNINSFFLWGLLRRGANCNNSCLRGKTPYPARRLSSFRSSGRVTICRSPLASVGHCSRGRSQ